MVLLPFHVDTGSVSASTPMASSAAGNSKPSVDDVWQKLKQEAKPRAPQGTSAKALSVDFNKLWQGFSSDTRPSGKPAATKKAAVQLEVDQLYKSPARPAAEAGSTALSASRTAQELPGPAASEQLVARCVAAMKDTSGTTRRRALQDIKDNILGNPQLRQAWLAERLESDLGKALLRRFEDPMEASRELAVCLLRQLLEAAPEAAMALLPYAFPVLAERLQYAANKAPVEPCEEVRLGLAQLLHTLIGLADRAVAAYAGEAIAMVGQLAADPYHEVQAACCAVVVRLNELLGLRLQPVSKQLVATLLPLATAKRHRVRVAALQALRVTMHQGAHEMVLEMVGWRDPNVIPIAAFYGDDLKVNFAGKLATDPNPQVRLEWLRTVGDWMTRLRERMDHEARLLPFVLSALNDEAPEIQAEAVDLLERLGVQYEKDHEKDLKDMLAYLPVEAHGIGWQADSGAVSHAYGALAAGQDATVHGGRAVLVLPGPLRARPRLGARRLVQTGFGRVVTAMCDELVGWLEEPRRRTAALLRTQLLLVEEMAGQHLHSLLPALCKAVTDPEVCGAVRDCAAILGCFVDPPLALALVGPRVADGGADLGQRAAALTILAGIVRGAGPRRVLDAHLGEVLDLLESVGVAKSEDTRVRRAVLEVLQALIDTCGPACPRHAKRLLLACLHLSVPDRSAPPPGAGLPASAATATAMASSSSVAAAAAVAADPTSCAEALIARLAEECSCNGGPDELVAQHRAALITSDDAIPDLSASTSPHIDGGVLARLLLPTASGRLHLLYAPEDVCCQVLPPQQLPPPAAAAAVPAAAPAGASAPCAGGGEACGSPQWLPGTTAPVLRRLRSQLPGLVAHPRCALVALLSLEAGLASAPVDDFAAGDAEAQEALLELLEDLLSRSLGLPPAPQLAALRTAHTALATGHLPLALPLPPPAAAAAAAEEQEPSGAVRLAAALAALAEGGTSAACRVQACHAMQQLAVALTAAANSNGGGCQTGLSGVQALLAQPAVVQAAASRLCDASDDVRCAAAELIASWLAAPKAQAMAEAAARQVRGGRVSASGAAGGSEAPGAAEVAAKALLQLVRDVVHLKDVAAPGTAFYSAHQRLLSDMQVRLPGLVVAAKGADAL